MTLFPIFKNSKYIGYNIAIVLDSAAKNSQVCNCSHVICRHFNSGYTLDYTFRIFVYFLEGNDPLCWRWIWLWPVANLGLQCIR